MADCHGLGFCLLYCFACLVALCVPASPAPPPCFFPPMGISVLFPWLMRQTCPAFTGNQPTISTLLGMLFSARASCFFSDLLHLFQQSRQWLFLFVFFDGVFLSIFCQVMQCASVSLASASPLVLLMIFYSGLLVLPHFLFSPSVVTYVFCFF